MKKKFKRVHPKMNDDSEQYFAVVSGKVHLKSDEDWH